MRRASTPALDHNNVVAKIGLYKRRWVGLVYGGGLKCKRSILKRANHAAASHPAEAATSCVIQRKGALRARDG